MRLAGARIAEAVGLDSTNLPTTQRRRLRIRGMGRKNWSVPVQQPELSMQVASDTTAWRFWTASMSRLCSGGGPLARRAGTGPGVSPRRCHLPT